MATTTALAISGDCRGLSDKHRRFVMEYVKCYDATEAARRAGYKDGPNLRITVNKLLKNDKIKRAIGRIERRTAEANLDIKQRLIEELSLISFRDLIDLVDKDGILKSNLHDVPPHVRRMIDGLDIDQYFEDGEISEQKIKIKLVPKMKAIENLMKHFGMYAPEEKKIEHSMNWDELYEEIGDHDAVEAQIKDVTEQSSEVENE